MLNYLSRVFLFFKRNKMTNIYLFIKKINYHLVAFLYFDHGVFMLQSGWLRGNLVI